MRGRWFLLSFLIVLSPLAARAQEGPSISGVVKDAQGSVIPGVTVEAASPALIEKVRTAVTDSSGVYRIVNLDPGAYTLTFALEGFNALPFLILKQSSDGRMGANDDPLLFVCSSDFSDLAEDLIRHRRRRLGIPSAFAISAGFGQRAQQILAHALAGNFNQPEVGNP